MSLTLRPGVALGATAVMAIAFAGCLGPVGAPAVAPGGMQTAPAPDRNGPPPAKTVAWGNFGFDSNQSGYNRFEKTLGKGTVGSLSEVWAAPGYGVDLSGIIESNGVIYASDYTSQNGPALQAFDEQTGSVLWTTATPNETPYDIAVGEGLVFAYTNGEHSVCAYKAKNGINAWCHNFPTSKYRTAAPESITYASGVVYVPLLGGPYVADALVALSAKTGGQLWSTNTDNGGCCSLANTTRPVVSEGRVYDECDVLVGTGSKAFVDWGICAYDASSGSEVWMYVPVPKTSFNFYLAAGKNGELYLSLLDANSTGPNLLLQGVSSSGSPLWGNGYNVCHSSQGEFDLAVDNKTLYAQMDSNGCSSKQLNSALYAFNITNGNQLWKVDEPNGDSTFLDAPVIANGVIYSLDQASGMMAFAASSGKQLWSSNAGASSGCYGHCSAQPIVVNGTVDTPCGGFGNTRLCAFGVPAEKKRRT